jgi:hypothetical protein
VANVAPAKPSDSPDAPIISGTTIPKRSANRPIRTPPTPKLTCTAGITTGTTYIGALPSVIRPSAAPRRTQA